MSRYQCISPDNRYVLAFGRDHVCGWFVQVYDTQDPRDAHRDTPVLDLDQAFDSIKASDIVRIAEEYGVGSFVNRIINGSVG